MDNSHHILNHAHLIDSTDHQKSRQKRPSAACGSAVRRKRKLERCLNELKQVLSSDVSSESSNSSNRTSKRLTGIDAVRQAIKILKDNNWEEEEWKPGRRDIELLPNGGLVPFSLHAFWSWSENALATDGDKCDDIVKEDQRSLHFTVSCDDGIVVEASENVSDILQLSSTGQLFHKLFSPNDQPFLVALLLNAGALFNPSHSTQNNHALHSVTPFFRFYASFRRGREEEECKYIHCRLICIPKLVQNCSNTENDGQPSRLLSVAALPLSVLFAVDGVECAELPSFYTKHASSSLITHVDQGCVHALGYMPGELIGQSFLSFISKDSLKWVEAAHEQAVKAKGKPVRSKVYHFQLRDGALASVQSEWSLFINPWTRETEFVIGYHKVLDRPNMANLFIEESCAMIKMATLDGRAAKAQSRIRRVLAKVKKHHDNHQHYSKKPLTSSPSTTTDKEQGSANANQTGSSNGADSYSSKSKRALNMGTYLDRMIESELFGNVNSTNTAETSARAAVCNFVIGEGNGDGVRASENVVPLHDHHHHETSPISAEAISSSPPESNGSGPTYKEINLKEKVARFLNSQTSTQSSSSPPDASSTATKSHHSGYSPPSYSALATQPVATAPKSMAPNSMEAVDLRTMAAAVSMMHRSRSAAGDLSQYRQLGQAGDMWNMPLTPEVLRQFTKEKERESKADWKRRYSTADPPGLIESNQHKSCDHISPSAIKRGQLEEVCGEAPPHKTPRPTDNVYYQLENRPSSMPIICRTPTATVDPAQSACRQPPWPTSAPLRNTTDYYRSLGPTPAPPPGKNFQISSAPLPAPTSSSSPPLAGGIDKTTPSHLHTPIPYKHSHQSAFAPPQPKAHPSVIQTPPFPTQAPIGGHWLNMPGASASAILQRMVPKALAREQAEAAGSSYWPPTNDPSLNSLDAYRRYEGPLQPNRQYFDYPTGPMGSMPYHNENMYNEYGMNSDNMTQQKRNDEV